VSRDFQRLVDLNPTADDNAVSTTLGELQFKKIQNIKRNDEEGMLADDTRRHLDDLFIINELGFASVDSQPGSCGFGRYGQDDEPRNFVYEQRFYLTGYTPRDLAYALYCRLQAMHPDEFSFHIKTQVAGEGPLVFAPRAMKRVSSSDDGR
jgi:hypothetical protein